MKRFLKSKLVLSLAAFLMIAAVVVIPLSGSITHSHAQSSLVTFAKSATPAVAPGGTINYTLTLTNITPTGSGNLHDIHLSDLLPSQTTGSFSAPTFTITPSGSASVDCTSSTTSSIACAVDDFAPGSVVTVSFSVSASNTATGTITNSATATTFSGNINETATANTTIVSTKRGKLFILLQGINTSLTQDQITDGNKPTFDQSNGIAHALRTQFPKSTILSYSYNGVDSQGNLKPYDCDVTFTNSLKDDIFHLDSEITSFLSNHPNTDVYLIGHSLGGVVAFGYLAFLRGFKFSLPNGGKLAGVITLDSPIGGISDDNHYLGDIDTFVRSIFGCADLGTFIGQFKELQGVEDLRHIFNSAHDSHPQGGEASLKQVIFGGKKLTNEELANEAAHAGIPVLTIGNLHDFLWDTAACSFPFDHVNFLSTQWLKDEASMQIHVYGRDIKVGDPCSGFGVVTSGLFHKLNHFEVLTNPNVIQALLQFLPDGGVPTKLMVAPPNPPNF